MATLASLIRFQQISFYASPSTLRGTEWVKRGKEFDITEELETFAAQRVSELDEYDQDLEKREED